MYVRGGPNTTDAALSVSTHFGAAGATATSNALDLGEANPNLVPRLELEVNVSALPNLGAGQSAGLKFQDSADGMNFADIGVGFTVNGVAGGTPAVARRVGLGSTVRQDVQLVETEPSGGGDLTGGTFEFHPVFFNI